MLNALPDTHIIKELRQKFLAKPNSSFDYVTTLTDFKKKVSDEVRYINVLFPEYTPHDADYHLSRLYDIADDILGDTLIKNLNATELLIVSIALYGHDWGMAVSEAEKELIVFDRLTSGADRTDFALLTNEHQDFIRFKNTNFPNIDEEITTEIWQEYVRSTHAWRSGARVRKYFQAIDKGIGEAAAKVCEGHWVDFKVIEDYHAYPVNYATCGELVNLKALAIYVRLVDLLDISRDRTPYIIWKFVAPKNARSKMEWQKHQAINSIKCDSFQSGRGIQIDGDTDDNEVYAALMDLKNYCSEQLKGCNEIINQLNDSRYDLNIFEINWRIIPRGFKAVSIQFEFDRARMFDVLSEEIYQGDKYVFLRELLQNSIDAIKLRREVLKKKGLMPSSELGLIEINVKDNDAGETIVEFIDDGAGMDEYIVRNYLSVAGKSYYSSDDFKKLGIPLDPISKFGVGVLSCFMVADQVDIETYRDPYCSPSAEALKIGIPSVYQQFRISIVNNDNAYIGTKFSIHISDEKLLEETRGVAVTELDVTKYVKLIAGFVEFPIKINDYGVKTVIVSPYFDKSEITNRFPDYEISSLNLQFPYEEALMPNSIKSAKKHFGEDTIDIANDLQIENATGRISFLRPLNANTTLTDIYTTWLFSEFTIDKKNNNSSLGRIQIRDHWTTYRDIYNVEREGFGKSASSKEQFQVYLDGILVPGAAVPEEFDAVRFSSPGVSRFALPHIIVNFDKKAIKGLDLSRTAIIDRHNSWANSLWIKYFTFIKGRYQQDIKPKSLKERLFDIARLCFYYRIPMRYLKVIVPAEDWPIPIIRNGGVFDVILATDFGDTIFMQPLFFNHFSKFALVAYQGHKYPKSKMDNWKNEDIVVCEVEEESDPTIFSNEVLFIVRFAADILSAEYELNRFRFLKPARKDVPPLIQPVYIKKSANAYKLDEHSDIQVIEKFATTTDDLEFYELNVLLDVINSESDTNYRIKLPLIGRFETPFNDRFAYSYKVLNWDNPRTKVLLRIATIGLMEDLRSDTIQSTMDLLNELPFFNPNIPGSGYHCEDVNSVFEALKNTLKNGNIKIDCSELTSINEEDFVDDSIYIDEAEDDKIFDFHARLNSDSFPSNPSMYKILQ